MQKNPINLNDPEKLLSIGEVATLLPVNFYDLLHCLNTGLFPVEHTSIITRKIKLKNIHLVSVISRN